MADMLTFGDAVQRAGVSRQRLNRAIHTDRLPAARRGGPGKPTRIRFEDLQVWCVSEGLPMPVDTMERSERSHAMARGPSNGASQGTFQDTGALTAQPDVAALMERLECTIEQAIDRAVDHVVERLAERLTARLTERLERPERSRRSTSAMPSPKAALLTRLRAMQAEGLSLQAIANQLNAEVCQRSAAKGAGR